MKASFVEAVIEEIIKPVLPKEWIQNTRYLVNRPAVLSLAVRKAIVYDRPKDHRDTYGGACPHGGGAFSARTRPRSTARPRMPRAM